jgi:hypothetical protein
MTGIRARPHRDLLANAFGIAYTGDDGASHVKIKGGNSNFPQFGTNFMYGRRPSIGFDAQ